MDMALTLDEFIDMLVDYADQHPEHRGMIIKFDGNHYNGEIVTGINHDYDDSCALWLEYQSDDDLGSKRPYWSSRTCEFIKRTIDGERIVFPTAKVE